MDIKDKFIAYFEKENYAWYKKDNFEEMLNNKFEILDRKESSPELTRTLYLAKKR